MDERLQADRLDRYLDGCLAHAAPDALDPDLARLARRYLVLGQSAAPPGARERVLGRITPPPPPPPHDAGPGREFSPRLFVLPAIDGNGRQSTSRPILPPSLPDPPANTRRPVPRPVWLSAVLLLTLCVGAVVAREGHMLLARLASPATTFLSAPSSSGLAGAEILLNITVPALLVPSGDSVRTCLSQIVIPPHARSTWSARDAPCCPGTRLNYVIAGTYMVWPEGPVDILRPGEAPHTMPAGSEITLRAGEAILMGSDTPYSADNPGETPVELVQQILASPPAFPRGTATLAGWDEHDYDMRDIPLQGGSMTMRLVRTTLEPKERLTPPPGVEMMQISSDPSHAYDIASSFSDDHSIVNVSKSTITLYLLFLEPAELTLMP